MKDAIIFCVDDEAMVLKSLRRELHVALGNDYLIETAENGEDALDVLQELLANQYDVPVIISDHVMPGMKGDELLKRVHAISPKTRKIMLTGQANIQAITNAVKHGKAKNIRVRLSSRNGSVVLSVENDGLDFPAEPGRVEGMGLKIMRYRAELMNSSLAVCKGARGGTIVTCMLPKEANP